MTVQFSLDVNGILQVKTHDRGSGRETGITVTAMKERLSQEQIGQAQKRLAETSPALALNEAGQALVDRARKLLGGAESEPEGAQDLIEALGMIDEARRLGDEPEMENWLEELTDLLYKLEDSSAQSHTCPYQRRFARHTIYARAEADAMLAGMIERHCRSRWTTSTSCSDG